jgi:hypothetical protein
VTAEEKDIYNRLIQLANLGMEIQVGIDSYRKNMALYRDNRNNAYKGKADIELWQANEKGLKYKKLFNQLLNELTKSKGEYAK